MDSPIEFKHVITRIPYKIEPKPEGGFVARAADPTVPALEAPTREELHQKIFAAIRAEFPQLNLGASSKNVEVSLQVDAQKGGFSYSTIPSADGSTPNLSELESRSLEKLLGFAAKHLTPELSKQLAAQAGNASFKLVINKNVWLRGNSGPQGLTFGAPKNPSLSAGAGIPQLDAGAGTIDGRPITPEPSNIRRTLKFIMWVVILLSVFYLYLLSR